jgi:hypothetical protein
MKRLIWIAIGCVVMGVAAIWAATMMEAAHTEIASMMPEGALLYIQAKDFQSLVKDWNDSPEKRTWIQGDDYAAFSRSRLFERLAQAQEEFSTAARISVNENLLGSIAGKQAALGLYDIGNLEFVYITRMDQAAVETTPLWQVRSIFEQRSEGGATFFVHHDAQSNRTAAFAARDGWLVLATREDLVAGVLDRIQGSHPRSLPDEAWYADAIKQATGPADDLRMVLNLEKIVPSPYFRSYWVQRNITEMKQYRSAMSDLHRDAGAYREDRILLRKASPPPNAPADILPLASLAPSDAAFYSAQASPGDELLMNDLRENFLDLKSAPVRGAWPAPAPITPENAGSASMLEERIDVAPVIVKQSDPYQPLRALLHNVQPGAVLVVYSTRAAKDEMFVDIDRAIVIEAAQAWDQSAVQSALTAAIRPGLTASQLGVGWKQQSTDTVAYSSLDGKVPLYIATRDKQLFLATDSGLLEGMLKRQLAAGQSTGVTYASAFRHNPREQRIFRQVVERLDRAGHASSMGSTSTDQNADGAPGQGPPFFSGNVASLSRMFSQMTVESIQERDHGSQVSQTVLYQWQRP